MSAASQQHSVGSDGELYRHDGVRITHDPFSDGMAEKYGAPGSTDREGFDPYADSVGAGIYSGTVVRDEHGAITVGQQYQNHNPNPGPVYSGGGYTPISMAIAKFHQEAAAYWAAASAPSAAATPSAPGVLPETATTLGKLLAQHPDLVNDVSTGGALPLHTCGMSRDNQHAAAFLIAHGADLEAVDTYGYTPLHRMASNNLAIGAAALLDAGADPKGLKGSGVADTKRTPSPMEVAASARARDVVAVLQQHHGSRTNEESTWIKSIEIYDAGYADVVGRYNLVREGAETIPTGFATVCVDNKWPADETWKQLNGGDGGRYYTHADDGNDSYIYFNNADKHWWIDGPDGLGAYKAPGPNWAVPAGTLRWQNLKKGGSAFGPIIGVNRD